MSPIKRRLLYLMSALYVLAGFNHLMNPAFYLAIMPPDLPDPEQLNVIAGLAEIVLGVYLLEPRVRSLAAWGIIALLVAVFPANLYVALENVGLPLTYRSGVSKAEMKAAVDKALERVNMAHRASHRPNQLSGGQQQRVAVARALVGTPSLILADEPTGNLDQANGDQLMELLDQLHGEGATLITVTHNPLYAERASRRIHMLDGKLKPDA